MIRKFTAISVLALCAANSAFAAENCQGPWTTNQSELTALDGDKRAAEIRRLIDCAKAATTETQSRLSSISSVQFDQMINDLIDERAALQKLYDDRKQAIGQLENEIVSRITERDDALTKLKAAESQLSVTQENLSVLTAEREKLNAAIAENTLDIKNLEDEIARLQNDNKGLKEKNDSLTSDNTLMSKDIAELKKSIDEKTSELSASKSKSEEQDKKISSISKELQEAKDALVASQSLQTETAARLNEALTKIEKLTTENQQIQSERDSLNNDIAELKAKKIELEKQIESISSDKANLLADLAKAQAENDKLKGQVDALYGVRSEFFAKLKEKLKDQKSIRIVGDRFIIQSEVLFDVGSPNLNSHGVAQIKEVAKLLNEVSVSFPTGIHWVLQVNGHTDIQKIIPGGKFASNWELSTARALTVVKLMQSEGVSPKNLVAAGFGEYQPVDEGKTQESFARNRRIELKLTDDGPYK